MTKSSRKPPRPFTENELRLIHNLIEDECPVMEIARTVNRHGTFLSQKFPVPNRCRQPLGAYYIRLARELGVWHNKIDPV